MHFEFATATRIVFGAGRRSELPALCSQFGQRPLVVTGADASRHQWLFDALRERGLSASHFRVTGEPTTDDARHVVELGQEHGVDLVLGIGGGSALDLGKAAAALLGNGGDPMDYLEVVGRGQKLTKSSLPYVAVPTTSGTGAEVTKNAVLDAQEHGVKVSLRGASMLPAVALLDPELTLSVPPAVTASTGFDALAQVIEPFVSCKANPLTDALCREGISRGARSLLRTYQDGADLAARTDMALTSLMGGLALANAKLGAVHGFAGPLGGMYRAPHGALCAALLPHVLRVNVEALRSDSASGPYLERFDEVGRLLTRRAAATADDAVTWCEETARALKISRLGRYGITAGDFDAIIEKAQRASSMQGNPTTLAPERLREILAAAL